MRNKKIVFLVPEVGINYEQSGGAGTHIRGTIEGLKKSGVDVLPLLAGDIFGITSESSLKVNAIKKSSLRASLKKIVPVKMKFLFRDFRRIYFDYKFEKKIIDQIREYSPDAIYERSALFSISGVRLSKSLNIPLILESDGCMPEITSMDFGLFSIRLANLIEGYKLRKANYISAYNEFSKLFLAKKFNVPLNKIVVKPLGISLAEGSFTMAEVEQLKQKYDLQHKKVVGFVGAISKYHGVDFLVDMARILLEKKITDIAIVIVGWSGEAQELKLKAEKLNLSNVIFTGRVDKKIIPLYYQMFDVGVIPDSEPTIYPVKVLEYGAYGLCPVVPDYKVFDEIMINKVHGFYFKKKNSYSLAELLIGIFKSTSYKTVANNWQQKVLSDCTWEKSVRGVVTVLNDIRK
ncbi:MAG: glycosyltransferase family 4 protein [Bacteroidota bacterium]